ncbi:hypothetical protein [Kitasatospora sp. GAS1066B]|uniref:hypothetical protein n=1 Tax=Kitasatospora sp. GAS1066B TaxID=3156271 RepID=UPI0035125B01
MKATTMHPQGTPQTGAAPGPAVPPAAATLRPVGPHLVIAPPGAEDDSLWAALGGLPAVPDALILLVATANAAPVLRQQLPELARTARARGASTIVLAASGLAAAAGSGRRPAEQVAGMVGLTVIAPDGMVSIQPDGTLEVTPAGPGGAASWWRCTATGPAEPLGASWPAPVFEAELVAPVAPVAFEAPIAAPSPQPGGPAVTPLQCGYWIRSAAFDDDAVLGPRLDSLAADPGTLVLVVGHPAAPVVPASVLATTVRTHAPASAGLLLSAPWADPEQLVALATELAWELDRDVRAAVGLPALTGSGNSTVLLGPDGSATWEPYLTELTASPSRGRVVATSWRHRQDGWTPLAPALFGVPALPGWLLEAIPAGLWLRTDGHPADPATRLLPPDPNRPVLVVGEPDRPVAQEVFERLGQLLDGLPPGSPVRPGLLVDASLSADLRAVARFVARVHQLDWVERPAAVPAPAQASTEPALIAAPAQLATMASAAQPGRPLGVIGAREPDPVPIPAIEPEPAEAVTDSLSLSLSPRAFCSDGPSVQAGASTPEDREQLKALLGPTFVRLANKADQIATRLPGLRSTTVADIKADLVAVLLHHTDTGVPATRTELIDAARGDRPSHLSAFLTCLGSGLRRLPSHHGAVLLGAIAGERELEQYTPGSLLLEPAPVAALPAHDVELGAPVEFAVWSTTGRRTALFGAPGDEPAVVFPPGTRFSVLSVLPSTEPGTPSRVLLREVSATTEDDRGANRERGIQDRLLSWLERRDRLSAQERRAIDRPERFHLTPGVTLS